MMYKKLIAFLLAIIFLFSNMGAVAAKEETYVNSSSVSDYVIMYLLKELDITGTSKVIQIGSACCCENFNEEIVREMIRNDVIYYEIEALKEEGKIRTLDHLDRQNVTED